MKFPSWPKANEKGTQEKEPVPQELLELVGSDDQESIGKAVETLKEIVEESPKTGRSIEKQSREFVIPVTSHEQKQRTLDALYELGIFPWEEKGQIIVDHKKDLNKLEAIDLIIRPKEIRETISREPEHRADSDIRFPLPNAPVTPPEERSPNAALVAGERARERATEEKSDTPLEAGLDTEWEDTVDRFDQGLLDEDDPEFIRTVGSLPSLKLFPRQYIWKGRKVFEKRTGNEVSEEEQAELYAKAREGDAKAINTLTCMSTGLVLNVLERVKKTFGGDPDDLLQEGMIGLLKAISTYDPEQARFSTFATPIIEQRMRAYVYRYKHPITRPANVSYQSSELIRAKKRFTNDGSIDPTAVLQEVPNQLRKIIANKVTTIPASGVGLDRLERLYLLNAAFDPITNEEDNAVDRARSVEPEELGSEAALFEYLRQGELKESVSRALLSLPPREERVLRQRFGIPSDNDKTLESVGEDFDVNRERIRQIEAKALRKLKQPARSRALRALLEDES